MRAHSRLILVPTLCLGAIFAGAHVTLDAQAAPSSYIANCQVGALAAPGDPGYGPYSADYFSPQFSFGYDKPVHLTFSAYTPLNDTPPTVASSQVLRSDSSPLTTQTYPIAAT